jgi:hypothetical protein
LGEGYEAFVERLQSDFAVTSGGKGAGATSNAAAAHPPHPTQSQLHQSRYVGYPSTSHAFTVKRETSPSVSESSMRSRESYSLEVNMQEAVTSPAPPGVSGSGGPPPRMPSPAHNFSTDVNQMPDTPPRRRGHRRAQSEIAFRLPDEASFEREIGAHGSEMPTLSDDGAEDLFSMYIDMEQINNFSGTSSGQAGAKSAAGEGSNAPPPTHHARSLSVDGALGNLTGNRTGVGGSSSTGSEVRRPRHQHSSSMDGSTSFKLDMLSEFEGDTKKVMASAKLSEIALIDPKRAKRSDASKKDIMFFLKKN